MGGHQGFVTLFILCGISTNIGHLDYGFRQKQVWRKYTLSIYNQTMHRSETSEFNGDQIHQSILTLFSPVTQFRLVVHIYPKTCHHEHQSAFEKCTHENSSLRREKGMRVAQCDLKLFTNQGSRPM